MTSTLPRDIQEVFQRFITTEYTTIDSLQQPIVWPVTPYYSSGGETIDVTTGIGYPKKADDAERNPHVSLLFSEPTGSGIERPPSVLVQGTATIDDADLDANRERYMRESLEKLPATKSMLPPKPVQGMFNWYFGRLYVKVRPERVFVWPEGDVTRPPELHGAHVEEVRSGHSEEPLEPHEPPTGGGPVWDERIGELGRRYDTAVLSWVGPDGFPIAVRLPVSLDEGARRIRFDSEPAGLPLCEGRASICAHEHAPDFSWQENFQVRGDLTRDDAGWAVVPRKLVGGFEIPDESSFARNRRNFRKMLRFRRIAKRRERTAG